MFKFFIVVLFMMPPVLFASSQPQEKQFESSFSIIQQQYDFQPIGETTFSILFWDLYKSRLLTTSGRYPINSSDEKLIYEINYLASISSDDLIKRTQEQWDHLGVSSHLYNRFLPELKRIWPNIDKGDTLSLLLFNDGSYFYFNQKFIGGIKDPAFGQIFLDIWLAENTSQPNLRAELLRGNRYE
tara:strand:- start:209 stop:763 length:555 start_codon:yes stop_codon:yes gene_type:complete